MEKQQLARIETLRDGVYRIGIPVPFPMKFVYCYLFPDDSGYTLVDTGLNYKKAKAAWNEAFEDLAINPRSIHTIIVTHFHPDHSGLAGYMQELTGAEVWMSETDRAMFERAFVKNKEQAVHVEHMLSKHGTPTELIKAILENLENITAHVQPFATIQAIKEKEWNLGRKRWKIYETPGHSQGHLCFFQEDENVLLSADMILDTITPNISLWPGGSQRPLEDYLSSLNRLKQLSAKEVWPGHGGVIQDVAKRIDELIHHHEVRLNRIAELASDQTGYAIAESLFAEKNLTSHQWRFAIGETLAHLEYLVDQERIQRINADPIRFAG